jgi:hypothetical protein
MELFFHIAALFWEIIIVLGSWLLGACVIKLFTLGRGRVGHINNLQYCKKATEVMKLSMFHPQEHEDMQLAERTLWIGMACWMIPLLSLLAFVIYLAS